MRFPFAHFISVLHSLFKGRFLPRSKKILTFVGPWLQVLHEWKQSIPEQWDENYAGLFVINLYSAYQSDLKSVSLMEWCRIPLFMVWIYFIVIS